MKGPIVIERRLLPDEGFRKWWDREVGEELPGDLHVTVLFSETLRFDWPQLKLGSLTVPASSFGHGRALEVFGWGHKVNVLRFDCPILKQRNAWLQKNGASKGDYRPHVTLGDRPLVRGEHALPYLGPLFFAQEEAKTPQRFRAQGVELPF